MTRQEYEEKKKQEHKQKDLEMLKDAKVYIFNCLTDYANKHNWNRYSLSNNSFQDLYLLAWNDVKYLSVPNNMIVEYIDEYDIERYSFTQEMIHWIEALSFPYLAEWTEEWCHGYFK